VASIAREEAPRVENSVYQAFFLWRFDFKRLRRLCFDILSLRFFFRLPIDFSPLKFRKSPRTCAFAPSL